MNTEKYAKVLCVVLALSFIVPTTMVMCVNASVITTDDVVMQRAGVIDNSVYESNIVDYIEKSIIDDSVVPQSTFMDSPLVESEDIRSKFWEFVDGDFSHSVSPINYLNNEDWTPINTTLCLRDNETFGGEYVAVCNENIFSVMFKDNVNYDAYIAVSTPVEIGGIPYDSTLDINYGRAYYYNKTTEDIQYVDNGTGNLTVEYGNVASYSIYENITERYVVASDGLKHYYIVDNLNRTDPVWWGENTEFVIPFTVEYNDIEFELQSDGVLIEESCEVQNVSIISKLSGERVYIIDDIRVFDDVTSLDVGHYYIDYYPGQVTITTNISIPDIYLIKDKFVIDPVWVIEYTATGRIDGTYDNYDWSDEFGDDYGIPMMDYVDKRIGESYSGIPAYDDYIELPRRTDANYLYCSDNFNYGKVDYSPIIPGVDGGWDYIYSPAEYSEFYGNTTSVPSVSGDAVRFTNYGGAYRMMGGYDFSPSVGVNCRDIDFRIDANATMPAYATGEAVQGRFQITMNMDGPCSFPPYVTMAYNFNPTNPFACYKYFQVWDYWTISGTGHTYKTFNLTYDDWYTIRFYNLTFSDQNGERGYQYLEYNVNVYNSTATVCDVHCIIDYDVVGYPYVQEVYGITGFEVLFEGYSVNKTRTTSVEIDDLRVYKDDVYDTQSYAMTKATIQMMSEVDYELLYEYDVFVMYLEYNQYYRNNIYGSSVSVQYNNSMGEWDWIPDEDLPGNSEGFPIIDVSNTFYYSRNTTFNHYNGVIIIDLSMLDADKIHDGTYKNIRFGFFTVVPDLKDFGITIKNWNLWYVKGYVASYYSTDSLMVQTVSGILPMTNVYYPTEVNSNIRFSLLHSLFGNIEPMAGTRIYYQNSSSQPSQDDDDWIQITDNIFYFDNIVEDWVEYTGDYDFIPTKTFKTSNFGTINLNSFNWYPMFGVDEMSDCWFKTMTINAGFTVVSVQVSDSNVEVIHNRAPIVSFVDNITVTGREPVVFDSTNVFCYDDGGESNILTYRYIITGVGYVREFNLNTRNVTFILPDDGVYYVELQISDSQYLGDSDVMTATNINALPVLYIRKSSVTVDSEAIPIEKLAVGDNAVIKLEESYDDDGYIVSYGIDFGDGELATYASRGEGIYPTIEHTYISAGTYTTNITSTDDDGDTAFSSIIFVVVDNIVFGYVGDRTDVVVSSEGIPIVANVNEIKNASKYDFLAKYLFKESTVLVLEKNSLFTSELDDRLDDDNNTDYADTLDIDIKVNYMDENAVWKQGKVFGSDILVYMVDDDVTSMISKDIGADVLTSFSDGNLALNVNEDFDSIVVVVNPSMWFKIKTVCGSRNIVDMIDIDVDTVIGTRNLEELEFGEEFVY